MKQSKSAKSNLPTKDKKVLICPKCGSIDVGTDFSNPVVWGAGTPTNYKCNKCNYRNLLFPEINLSEVEEYRDNLKIAKSNNEVKETINPQIETKTGTMVGYFEIIFLVISLGFAMLAGEYWLVIIIFVVGIFLMKIRRNIKK